MSEKIKCWLPYMFLSKERKEEERQRAREALLEVAASANYSISICSQVYMAKQYLDSGANPRVIMREIPCYLERSRKYPNESNSDVGGLIKMMFIDKVVRKKFIDALFNKSL